MAHPNSTVHRTIPWVWYVRIQPRGVFLWKWMGSTERRPRNLKSVFYRRHPPWAICDNPVPQLVGLQNSEKADKRPGARSPTGKSRWFCPKHSTRAYKEKERTEGILWCFHYYRCVFNLFSSPVGCKFLSPICDTYQSFISGGAAIKLPFLCQLTL